MSTQADEAAGYLKALAHEGRLMILCHLLDGEKSVTELESLLASRQAAVSQQLARLRLEGLVKARRDGKAIYYSLSDPKTARMIGLLNELFCR
ncbi:ArsR/SmtB family transcription factor [Albidovulum sp.]|uniref:ArsR/SmtB family transcription factor n=1 Tax=Albidovulum sp. TaxID=1872424 RepID=UPI0025C1C8CB|nr:metalloregulator ArsR/SmtB family transcription factor [Defluviimonas sp.]